MACNDFDFALVDLNKALFALARLSDEIACMCKMGVSDFAISKISLMPRYFVIGAHLHDKYRSGQHTFGNNNV